MLRKTTRVKGRRRGDEVKEKKKKRGLGRTKRFDVKEEF